MNIHFDLSDVAESEHRHLLKILGRVADGWHVWASPDPGDGAYSALFEAFGTYRELAEKSYLTSRAYPPAHPPRDLVVTRSGRKGEAGAVIELDLEAAAVSLDQPLLLVVENESSDGAFYRLCFDAVDIELSKCLAGPTPAAQFYNGGGSTIPELVKLRAAHAIKYGLLLRMVVLIDSDGMVPGHTSKPAKRVEDTGAEYGVRVVVLKKRAIENYAPDDVVTAIGGLFPDLQASAEFIVGLPPAVRDHYPLKRGFASKDGTVDRPISDDERALYDEIVFPAWAPALKTLAAFMRGTQSPPLTASSLETRAALPEIKEICSKIGREL